MDMLLDQFKMPDDMIGGEQVDPLGSTPATSPRLPTSRIFFQKIV
jgi:hypothetical protein